MVSIISFILWLWLSEDVVKTVKAFTEMLTSIYLQNFIYRCFRGYINSSINYYFYIMYYYSIVNTLFVVIIGLDYTERIYSFTPKKNKKHL